MANHGPGRWDPILVKQVKQFDYDSTWIWDPARPVFGAGVIEAAPEEFFVKAEDKCWAQGRRLGSALCEDEMIGRIEQETPCDQ